MWNYIHIDGVVPENGSEIEFQSKTPRFRGTLGSTGTCNVGCRNSSELLGLSRHPSDGSIGFIPESCSVGIEGRHCRLEGAGETYCESLRLRVPCTETSAWIEPTAPSSMSSVYPLF